MECPFPSPGLQDPAAGAAAAAPSQILPLSFTPPHTNSSPVLPSSAKSYNLCQRSRSLPSNLSSSLKSPALLPNSLQQEEQKGVPVPIIGTRSKSLRELLAAERSDVLTADRDVLSVIANCSSEQTNQSQGTQYVVRCRSSSCGHSSLQELLSSDAKYSPNGMVFKFRRRRSISWKLSFPSPKVISKEKDVRNSTMPKKDSSSELQKAVSHKRDRKFEAKRVQKLHIASSQHKKPANDPKESGCGKLEIKPLHECRDRMIPFERSESSRAAFSKQASMFSTQGQYYLGGRKAGVRARRRTNLPYREQLISFFCCVPAKTHCCVC